MKIYIIENSKPEDFNVIDEDIIEYNFFREHKRYFMKKNI